MNMTTDKNVAFFVGQFPKLSETFIINQVTGLIDQGFDVTIFANHRPKENIQHDLVKEYDLYNRTNYVKSPTSYIEGANLLLKNIVKLARYYPGHIKELTSIVSRGKDLPIYVSNLLYFLEYNESFDICHAHFGPAGKNWSFIGDMADQGPFFVTFYGYDVSRLVHPNNYDYYNDLWSSCDQAIGITNHIKTKMILLGCPEEISLKHPIGIDTDKFSFSPLDYKSELKVTTIARFVEKKGIKYAIDAVADCVDKGINIQYRIAGDGPLRSEIEDQIQARNLGDNVKLLGWQSQHEISSLLKNTHISLQPSVTATNGDMEGQALVLQEAQAMGVPIISTYHNGIPEGVLENKSGKLVSERDSQSIMSAIQYFVENPEQIHQYGKNGREFIESEFDNKTIISKQKDIYFEAMRK